MKLHTTFALIPLAWTISHAAPVLKNPSFSDGTEQPDHWTETWTGSGKFSVSRDTGTYHGAPASLRLTSIGGPCKGQAMQSVDAKPGEVIEVTGYLRASQGATALLGVLAYDAQWKGLGFTAIGNALGGFDWVRASGKATLPADTARAAVVLMIEGSGSVWLDNVSTDGTDAGKDAKPVSAAEPAVTKPAGPRKAVSSTDPAEGFYPDYPHAWKQIVEGQIKRAKSGPAPVVFLGDSLTLGWSEQDVWKDWEAKGAVNFGVGGDGTPQLLWRIDHGMLDGLDPKLVVLQIGINNVWSGFDAADTIKGIGAVLDRIRAKAPKARLLVFGNTHFFDPGDGSGRKRVREINSGLATMADAGRFTFVDFSEDLLENDGNLKAGPYQADKLHLTPAAYALWAEKLRVFLAEATL